MKNFKIKLHGCKNGHITENITLDEFMNTQNADISKIICDKCKNKNKLETERNEFYKCLKCNMNLCTLCKYNHDHMQSIINMIKRIIFVINIMKLL